MRPGPVPLLLPLLFLPALSGCADPAALAPRIVVPQREAHAEAGDLSLSVTVHDHPDGVELRSVATNVGDRSLRGNVTCDVWSWRLSGPDGADDGRLCAAHAVVWMPPGSQSSDRLVWDATTLDDGRRRPLRVGDYAWRVRYCIDDPWHEDGAGCVEAQVPFRLA